MESDAFALRTALFVVLALFLSAVTWTVFRDSRFEYKPYLVVTDQSVSGLARTARIYYKGVEVGVVQDIFFGNNNFDQVRILIHVDHSIPIARNTYAQLALRGITGEYDLLLDNDGVLGQPLQTSIENPGVVTMRSEYIIKLGQAVEEALASIHDTSERVSELLSDENQRTFSKLLTSANNAAEQLSLIEQRIEPTLEKLPELVAEAKLTLTDYQSLAERMDGRTRGVEMLIQRMTEAATSLDDLSVSLRGQSVDALNESLVSISDTSRELQRVLEDIRQDPQRVLFGRPAETLGPGEAKGTSSQ